MTWRCFVTNWEKTCSNARDIFLSYWKTILAEQMYIEFEVCCKVSTKFNEKPGSKSIDYKATTWNEWSRSVDDCKHTRDGNGTVDWNGWNMAACAKSKWWGIYWIKVCLCGVHPNSLREYHEAPGFQKKNRIYVEALVHAEVMVSYDKLPLCISNLWPTQGSKMGSISTRKAEMKIEVQGLFPLMSQQLLLVL